MGGYKIIILIKPKLLYDIHMQLVTHVRYNFIFCFNMYKMKMLTCSKTSSTRPASTTSGLMMATVTPLFFAKPKNLYARIIEEKKVN